MGKLPKRNWTSVPHANYVESCPNNKEVDRAMPKVSVIVPVYNVEKYILKCLESLAAQTFPDYEVIIVNDGTKDRSAEIAEIFINY